MEKLKCNICGYDGKMEVLFQNINNIGDRKIILCPRCQVQFLYPPLSEEDKNNIYNNEEYDAWGNNNEIFSSMKKENFKNLIKKILRYKSSGNLLDVGCGPGYLLEEAKKIGFNSYGIELSTIASNIAKKEFGEDKIYNGTIETCDWKNMFDIITMTDLFEHVDDPVGTLIKSKELLNHTGGGIF